MTKKRVAVMNTAFRDGFQSVFGARVLTDDFLPAVEAARAAGFTHFEAGGGARFQALYLYCREDAFAMMDAFRRAAGPGANLQTLARGVSVVALDSQPSDVIRLHATLFARHGMTTIRNFDALNDVRNLAFSGRCIVEAGLQHEVVVALMGLPPGAGGGAHTADFYVGVLRQILDADVPFHSVCFKDASGTTPPRIVHDTVKAARALVGADIHLRVHTHESAGISVAQYLAALDAGVDGIDLALAPVSGGTSQPDAITMWQALRGSDYDLGLDIDRVIEASEVLKERLVDYVIPPEALAVEPIIPFSPMPGGALTANTQMMRDNGVFDRYARVIKGMGEVVRRGGYGTSVTPVSQFYFQQAFNNELFGPWKRVAEGYGKMVLGYFGKTPVPPDPEIVALAAEQLGLEPTTADPRELDDANPKKGLDAVRAQLEEANLPVTEENLFIVASCKDKGLAFLRGEGTLGVPKKKKGEGEGAGEAAAAAARTAAVPDVVTVTVDGRAYTVRFDDAGGAEVDGRRFEVSAAGGEGGGSAGGDERAEPSPSLDKSARASSSAPRHELRADLSAKVFKVVTKNGARVGAGDVLLVLEALKMEIEIKAPADGVVRDLEVAVGDAVAPGALLLTLA